MEKLLVVEDEQAVCAQLKAALKGEGSVVCADGTREAMRLFLQYFPKVVVLDLAVGQDRQEALTLLEWMERMQPGAKIVVLAEQQEREKAYRALACGAYDFHLKPVVEAELSAILRRALHLCEVEEQSRQLMEALERATGGIDVVPQGEVPQPFPLPCQGSHRGRDVQEGQHQKPMTMSGASQVTLKEARDTLEKNMVAEAIGNCGGNVSRASEMLGVSRPALYDLMKKYGFRFGRTNCRREVSAR